jgi:hypothetical protein
MTVSGIPRTRKEQQQICAQQMPSMPDPFFFLCNNGMKIVLSKGNAPFVSVTKL